MVLSLSLSLSCLSLRLKSKHLYICDFPKEVGFFLPALSSVFSKASAFSTGIGILDKLESKGPVVCAFLTNGLVDSYEGMGDIHAILSTTIGIYCNAIRNAQWRTGAHFTVLMPLPRPQPAWLQQQLGFIVDMIQKKLTGIEGIELLPTLSIADQLFESDGVHLNSLGLSVLHAHLMSNSTLFLKRLPSLSRLSTSDEVFHTVEPSTLTASASRKRSASPLPNSSAKIVKDDSHNLETTACSSTDNSGKSSMSTDDGVNITVLNSQSQNMIETIKSTIASEMGKYMQAQVITNRSVSDRLQKMEIETLYSSESADAALNQSNMHVILVTGLEGKLPRDRQEKNKLSTGTARSFLDQINSGKVDLMFATFIPGPPPRPGCLPMLKMAFGSIGDSFHVKRKFNEFRRSNTAKCANIYLTPELTRSTRVRAAILIAMCKKSQVQNFVKGARPQVSKFDIKPDICFREPKTGKIERRVCFKEACDRFLGLLTGDDLLIAKKIAGKAFAKRLRILFGINEQEKQDSEK